MPVCIIKHPNKHKRLCFSVEFPDIELLPAQHLKNIGLWIDHRLDKIEGFAYSAKCLVCDEDMIYKTVSIYTAKLDGRYYDYPDRKVFQCPTCKCISPNYNTKIDLLYEFHPVIKKNKSWNYIIKDQIDKIVDNMYVETNVIFEFIKALW